MDCISSSGGFSGVDAALLPSLEAPSFDKRVFDDPPPSDFSGEVGASSLREGGFRPFGILGFGKRL